MGYGAGDGNPTEAECVSSSFSSDLELHLEGPLLSLKAKLESLTLLLF